MAGEEEALRAHRSAEALGDAEHDPAQQRAPQRARAADDRGLEGEDELQRAGVGVEGRAHRQERAGNRHRRHGDRRRQRVDPSRVDADQADRVGILGGGADHAAELGVVEEELDAAEQRDRRRHGQRRELADGDVVGDRPTVVGEVADIGRERAGVGAELLEQQVVDDDRQAEGRQHRHQQAAARAALEHGALQPGADQRHRRDDGDEAEEGRDVVAVGEHEQRIGGEDRQAAVREVDDPHDAEHERQAAGDQRVIAAEQHALDDLVDEDHAGAPCSAPRRRPK